MKRFADEELDRRAASALRLIISEVANLPEVEQYNGPRSTAGAAALVVGVLVEACRKEAIRLTETEARMMEALK